MAKKFLLFKPAETLSRLLKRHGFTEAQVNQALKENFLPKGISLANGSSFRLRWTTDRHFVDIKIYEPIHDLAYVYWRKGAQAGSYKRDERYTVKPRIVRGRIDGSLLTSIMKVLPGEWVAHRFMDAYSLDYNLPRKLQRGARFAFKVETKWEGADMIGYGEILQTTLEIGGQVESRHYVAFPGGGSFLNPENSYRDRPLYSPVSYMRLSSLFEPRRFHPIKQRRQPHMGVDFEVPEGTDVYAAEGGEILRSGYQRAAGNYVVVLHNNGLETSYDHMQSLAPNMNPGRRIENGQKIGTVGCTGYCTKAHLHFAVRKNGHYVDPTKFLKGYPYRTQELMSAEHKRFDERSNL